MPDSPPERRVIYQGRKIDLALQAVRLSDGSTAEREVVVHRGAVALVPMVDAEHVCLVRNRRYAVDATLLEVPAGTIDRGESPDETAARELTEETGYRAGRIVRVAEWFVSPGVMSERMFLYLCHELTPGPTPPPARRDARAAHRRLARGRPDGPRRPDRGRQDDAGPPLLRPAPRTGGPMTGPLPRHRAKGKWLGTSTASWMLSPGSGLCRALRKRSSS